MMIHRHLCWAAALLMLTAGAVLKLAILVACRETNYSLEWNAYEPAAVKAGVDRKMDSATFAKAVQLFGKKGAMDLVAVMNTYAVSGFYATAVDEHMPAGRPDLERPARQ